MVHDGKLLIQFDQASADDGKSRLFALDAQTGKTLWETKRDVPNSWATPLVVQAEDGTSQIITTADPWVIAYDVADGKELWRIKCLSGDQGISPVIADGLLQIGNEYCQWQAIQLDLKHRGELPEEAILWTGEDGLPDTVSPVVINGLLLLTTSDGLSPATTRPRARCFGRKSLTLSLPLRLVWSASTSITSPKKEMVGCWSRLVKVASE